MEKTKEYTSPYEMDGRIPWPKAIVYGLQHVLAMFVGNLTPLIVICGACGIGAASDFAEVYVELLQNAMILSEQDENELYNDLQNNSNKIQKVIDECGYGDQIIIVAKKIN